MNPIFVQIESGLLNVALIVHVATNSTDPLQVLTIDGCTYSLRGDDAKRVLAAVKNHTLTESSK